MKRTLAYCVDEEDPGFGGRGPLLCGGRGPLLCGRRGPWLWMKRTLVMWKKRTKALEEEDNGFG